MVRPHNEALQATGPRFGSIMSRKLSGVSRLRSPGKQTSGHAKRCGFSELGKAQGLCFSQPILTAPRR
jgi:hypothetical protein